MCCGTSTPVPSRGRGGGRGRDEEGWRTMAAQVQKAMGVNIVKSIVKNIVKNIAKNIVIAHIRIR
jgi:hypothetical protein